MPTDQEWRILKEKVEVLNGDRGDRAKSKAALRRDQLIATEKLVADLKASADALQKSLSGVQASVQAAQNDLNRLVSRAAATEEQLSQVESSLTQIGSEIGQIGQQISDVSDQAAANTGRLDSIDTQLTTIGSRRETAETSINSVSDGLSSLKTNAGAVTVQEITSSPVAAPPTAAEYNSLLDDLTSVRAALVNIQSAIAG